MRTALLFIVLMLHIAVKAQDSAFSLQKIYSNSVGVKYDVISFDKSGNKPWHFASLQYSKQFKKLSLISRLNYANRFDKTGLQLEADAYPVISKKIYGYVNAGYSASALLFPKYRGGSSLYIGLPAAFEAELGFRLLYFNSLTSIYTSSIGKYYKKFWFNLSTFVTPDSSRVSSAFFLKTRYYLNDKDFIMVTLGSGISPDDRNNNIQLKSNRLRSKKAEASIRKTISKVNILFLDIGWMRQYIPFKTDVNQYNIGVGFQRLF